MICALGFLCLSLTSYLGCVGGLAWKSKNPSRLQKHLSFSIFLGASFSLGALALSFLRSDFSVKVVALHSAYETPWIYKLSAVWSHHEGSFLLWIWVMSLYGWALSKSKTLPEKIKQPTLVFHHLLTGGLGVFITLTSNPFLRFSIPALNGQDLNPMLQDLSVVFHPPLLYLGYVGCAAIFSLVMGILWNRNTISPRIWAPLLRRWTLIAWSFLTLGITLGSLWAYYELGWGGWWFWDPVENASLMPWCAATALFHGLYIVEKTKDHPLQRWCLFLGWSTFALSLVGTFIVRSGLISSVHSFAQDPVKGYLLFGILLLILTPTASLLVLGQKYFKTEKIANLWSHTGGMLFQTLVMGAFMGTLLIGTFAPLIGEGLFGQVVTVAEGYYNGIFSLLSIPLLGILMLTLHGTPYENHRWVFGVVSPGLGAGLLILYGWIWGEPWLQTNWQFLCWCFLSLGVWVAASAVIDGLWRYQRLGVGSLGSSLAHLGLAIFVMAVSIDKGWSKEHLVSLSFNQVKTIGGRYQIRLETIRPVKGINYVSEQGVVHVTDLKNPKDSFVLTPENRLYFPSHTTLSESSLHLSLWRIFYVSMETLEDDKTSSILMRFYHHPGVPWIWISAWMMMFGGLYSALWSRQKKTAPQNLEPSGGPTYG